MTRRHACFFLTATLAGVAGSCGGGGSSLQPFQPSANDAHVRVVNAAPPIVTVTVNGTVLSSALLYSKGTGCFMTNSTTSGIDVGFPDTAVTYAQNGLDFIPGETANLFVSGDGVYYLLRVPVDTTPAAGTGRLQVLNISGSGNYDVYVTAPDAALVTPTDTGFRDGELGTPFDVAPGERHTRLTTFGTQTVAIDVGSRTWLAGDRWVLVVAPPAPGTTTPRGFMWTAAKC